MTETLYISDLDGTLLLPDASLSQYSRQMLVKLLHAGVLFTVASARSVYTIRQILGDIPLQLPVIEFNGAYLSDYHSGKHLTINALDQQVVNEAFELIVSSQMLPFISTFDGRDDRLYWTDILNEGMQWYIDNRTRAGDPRLRWVDNLQPALSDHVVCMTIVGQERDLGELNEQFSRRFDGGMQTVLYENQYSPGWWWLTVHSHAATKGQAVQHLAANWNLKNKRIVVFGDQINDIEMFRNADHAVAMGNAVAQLLPFADEVIGLSEDDAVVRYIVREVGLT